MQVVGSSKISIQGIVSSEKVYKGISDCFVKTFRESGIRGLYRGVGMRYNIACLHIVVFFLPFSE